MTSLNKIYKFTIYFKFNHDLLYFEQQYLML